MLLAMTDSLTPNVDLAPDYYLANFRFMLEWVWERYADLLNGEEQGFIQSFRQLEHDAQCLLVRLSSRQCALFRRARLRYDEIESIDTAAQHLIDAGLLQIDTAIDLDTLADALTKPELLALFGKHLAGLKQARKEILVQTLVAQFTEPCTWQMWTNNQF